MAVGGARPGAGRPKGGANRINDEARRRALAGGMSPLEFLLGVMRDEKQPLEKRMDAARSAAPFVHAKLQALQHSGPDGGPIKTQSATVIDAATMTPEQRDALRKLLQDVKANGAEQVRRVPQLSRKNSEP